MSHWRKFVFLHKNSLVKRFYVQKSLDLAPWIIGIYELPKSSVLHWISAKSIIIQDNSNGRRIRKTGLCTKLGKIDHNRATLPSQTNK